MVLPMIIRSKYITQLAVVSVDTEIDLGFYTIVALFYQITCYKLYFTRLIDMYII